MGRTEKEIRTDLYEKKKMLSTLRQEIHDLGTELEECMLPFPRGTVIQHKETGQKVRFIGLRDVDLYPNFKWFRGTKIKKDGTDYIYSSEFYTSYEEYEEYEEVKNEEIQE